MVREMSSLQIREQVSDLKAIGFALAGFTFWVLTDTSIKIVGQSGLPPYEMVAFLGAFMAVFLVIYGFVRGQQHLLRPHRLSRQAARACLDMVNNVCVVIALRHLTLTIFYILVFMAPIVISLLSAIFLREWLPWTLPATQAGTLRFALHTAPEPGATHHWVAVATDGAYGRPVQAVTLACAP